MPNFQFVGVDKQGKKHQGIQAGTDVQEVVNGLRAKGIYLTSVKETAGQDLKSLLTKEIHLFGPVVKPDEFVAFCRQFATLFRAGISMVEAMRILAEQTSNKTFRSVLQVVRSSLQQGTQLSEACSKHPRAFSATFVNMVEAGEATGNLDDVLDRLARVFERDYRNKQKVKAALTYPIFVSIVAIAVTIFLFVKIIPQFVQTFIQQNLELPLPTQIVIGISKFLSTYWYLAIIIVIALIVGFIGVRRTERGRYGIDFLLLRMPIFGKLIQKSVIARMSLTLSMLFSSAVPTLQAIRIAASIIENKVLQHELLKTLDSLKQGHGMAQPLKGSRYFPPLVVQMIATGEETGTIDQMLSRVAEFYESEVESTIERLRPLIEPIMIVVLGAIVGVVVLAVLVPMFKLYQNFH